MPKPAITPAERRYQDYLRQRGMRTANAYTRTLAKLRREEVARVARLLVERYNPRQWELVAPVLVNEAAYLPKWYEGIIVAAGMPMIGPTAHQLGIPYEEVKPLAGYFEGELTAYARDRAGAEISSVSGTMKETLQGILREEVAADPNIGVEALSKKLRVGFEERNEWMARRIAQTEMMNALAEAGEETAEALEVRYTKTWCISGLGNTRETHVAMDGVTVDQDGVFQLVDCVMRYPHDTRSNPPASQIVNCACSVIRRPL